MDIRAFNRRAVCALSVCVVAFALSACAGKESTKPPTSAAATMSPSAPSAEAAGDKPGLFGKMLNAVGIGKKDAPKKTAHELPLRIFTADNLNAGTGDKPLALVMKVYRLRSAHEFEQATFNDFLDDDAIKGVLDDALVDDRQMLLLPGQRYTSIQKLSADVHYIGFVGLFRGPAAHRWRFLYKVPDSIASGISLGVHACALSSTSGTLATQLASPPDSLASVHCPTPGS